ncbi:MAG: hybrid sensor histidine kinase/response regulator [Caldimonas sp.]
MPDRERAEAALRESEARYRSALTAGRMGSWETDLVARTRTWSQEGMELFGLTLPQGRGRVGGEGDEYLASLHPEDRHLAARFLELADRQDSFFAEYRIVRPDGSVLWLSGRGLVVARQPDGKAHRLVSVMADVTDRRQAQEGLRVERERLELALKAGQMGVYDFDIVRDSLWWSPQTYGVFGVDPERFRPTRESVAGLIHPDDRETFLRRRAEAMAERRPFLHEFRIVRSDGSIRWIGHRGQTEYDARGVPVRTFGIALDITERKQAEQALQDADRKKDNFIATLAHELRNPLAPIRNAVSVLRQRGPLDPEVVSWCRDVIDRQVTQMSRLLEDLLDVSRMTRGQFALRRERLDIATVVEQAIEIAQPLIEDAGHALALTLPAEPIGIEGDLTRLAQVFSNLLINAAKYTQPGGRIGLTVEVQGREVVVTVTDSGIGIAAEQMPRIFEMFGQAASALDRSQGGLGIGLSLAKGFVELHGGRIGARSEGVGAGSEFFVRLPIAGSAGRSATSGEAASDADPAARTGKLRILIADDLRDSADSLALLLESMGHEVHIAYDGEQALQAIEALRPDVALLDLGMPKLSGFEVCRRIRALPWGSAMALVAQSGWGQDEDRRRTRAAGFDHHIVKPIDPLALDALLRTLGPKA